MLIDTRGREVVDIPLGKTSPMLGVSCPRIVLNVVVFPSSLGPSMVKIFPMEKDKLPALHVSSFLHWFY